jgi:hypothetical protein
MNQQAHRETQRSRPGAAAQISLFMLIWLLLQMLFAISVLLGPLGENLDQITVTKPDGDFSFTLSPDTVQPLLATLSPGRPAAIWWSAAGLLATISAVVLMRYLAGGPRLLDLGLRARPAGARPADWPAGVPDHPGGRADRWVGAGCAEEHQRQHGWRCSRHLRVCRNQRRGPGARLSLASVGAGLRHCRRRDRLVGDLQLVAPVQPWRRHRRAHRPLRGGPAVRVCLPGDTPALAADRAAPELEHERRADLRLSRERLAWPGGYWRWR